MAKLVSPGYGSVQSLRTVGPEKALREGRQVQSAFENVAQLGRDVTNYAQELEQNESSTNASLEFSEVYNDLTAKPYISTDEAIEMGAVDGPHLWEEDTDGNIQPRQEIPIWEILPEVAQSKYEKVVQKHADKISGYGNRQEWLNRRRQAGQQMYDQLKGEQRQAMFQRSVERANESMEVARQSGDYNLMLAIAAKHPEVEKRESLVRAARETAETDNLHRALQSGDPELMRNLASYLRDSEDYSFMSEANQTQWIQVLENTAKSYEAKETTAILREADDMLRTYQVQIAMEDPAAIQTLSKMDTYLKAQGEDHYFGKQFFANELANYAELTAEWQHNAEIQAAYAAPNGYATVDMMDSDNKKIIDKAVEVDIGRAMQEGGPQAALGAIEEHVQLAARNNYLPQYFVHMFNSANSPAAKGEQLELAVGVWETINHGNQHLLRGMDEQTINAVASIAGMVRRAGMSVDEAHKAYWANSRGQSTDFQEHLRKQVRSYIQKDTDPNTGTLEAKIRMSRSHPLVPDWMEAIYRNVEEMGVSEQMAYTYDTLVEDFYVMNGGDKEAAQDAAFASLINTQQLSQVNGNMQYMRDAPEMRYGLMSEDIRNDFQDWVTPYLPEGTSKDDLMMMPDLATAQEDRPGYVVWQIDEFGMPVPVMAPKGNVQLRYYPRAKKIKEDKVVQRVLDARNERTAHETNLIEREVMRSHGELLRRREEQFAEPERRQQAEEEAAERDSRLEVVNERSDRMAEEREILRRTGFLNE